MLGARCSWHQNRQPNRSWIWCAGLAVAVPWKHKLWHDTSSWARRWRKLGLSFPRLEPGCSQLARKYRRFLGKGAETRSNMMGWTGPVFSDCWPRFAVILWMMYPAASSEMRDFNVSRRKSKHPSVSARHFTCCAASVSLPCGKSRPT